jgi:GWxTD domain-containing protein
MDEPPSGALRNAEASFEAVQAINRDTSRTTVYIQYRIGQRFFTFTRTQSAQGLEEYEAKGEVSVEILNAQGLSIARDFRPVRLVRPFQPRDNERLPDIQGVIPFVVPNGTFRAVTEVRDVQSGKTFADKSVAVNSARTGTVRWLPPPILVDEPRPDSSATHRFAAVNRAGRVVFGTAGGALVHVLLPDTISPLRVKWNLKGAPPDWFFLPQSFLDSVATAFRGSPVPAVGADGIEYRVSPDSGAFRTLFIPLPLKRLGPAPYSLSIQIDIGKTTMRFESAFEVVWPMRPFSLADFDLAVNALQHIMTRGELDSLKSESTAEGQRQFREFWQKRNSDTTRALNTALAEYYRRVDEAIRQFSGVNDRTGYLTDQGRILILFGTPSRVERSLKPGTGRTITWTYTRLRKMFTFSDAERRDFFVLVRVDEL